MKFKKVTVTGIICNAVLVDMAVTAIAKNDFDSRELPQNRKGTRVVSIDDSGNAIKEVIT